MNRGMSLNFCISYFLNGWKEIFFHNSPIFITFFITSRCNAGCEHCLYWKRLNKIKDELTLVEIKKISNTIGRFPKLLLSGGEPFLREDIDEICNIFYFNNKVRQITIPTNGILSNVIYTKTRNILKSCVKANIQVQLSIDGLGEQHDKIRNVSGAFSKMMNTYLMLKELEKKHKNFEIIFCFTFSALNQDCVFEVYDYLCKQGNKNLVLLLTRAPVKNSSLLRFDFHKYEKANKRILKDMFLQWKDISEFIFATRRKKQLEIIRRVSKNDDFSVKCRAAILTAVIDELGIVYSCESCRNVLGSLREEEYRFEKIWHGDLASSFRNRLRVNKCRCTHESNTITNISFSLKSYFSFFKTYLMG